MRVLECRQQAEEALLLSEEEGEHHQGVCNTPTPISRIVRSLPSLPRSFVWLLACADPGGVESITTGMPLAIRDTGFDCYM